MAEFTVSMLLAKAQEFVNAEFQAEWERRRESVDRQSDRLERSIARVDRAIAEVRSTTEALQVALQKTHDRVVEKLPKFRQLLADFKSTTGVDLLAMDLSRINWQRLEKRYKLRIEEERALRRAAIWINELGQPIPILSEEERLRRWAGDQWVAWNAARKELQEAESEARWIDDSVERICPPPSPEEIRTLEDVEDVDDDILDRLVDYLQANRPECITVKHEYALGSSWREVKIHLPDGSKMEFELD